jgi:hypothetical protein
VQKKKVFKPASGVIILGEGRDEWGRLLNVRLVEDQNRLVVGERRDLDLICGGVT